LVATTLGAPLCAPSGLLATAPECKSDDQRAEQPIAAANPRLTRTADPTTIRLARLNRLSIMEWREISALPQLKGDGDPIIFGAVHGRVVHDHHLTTPPVETNMAVTKDAPT
jgi:hypothetical protein